MDKRRPRRMETNRSSLLNSDPIAAIPVDYRQAFSHYEEHAASDSAVMLVPENKEAEELRNDIESHDLGERSDTVVVLLNKAIELSTLNEPPDLAVILVTENTDVEEPQNDADNEAIGCQSELFPQTSSLRFIVRNWSYLRWRLQLWIDRS
ncbi:hypothetical protein BJ742DRAFT_832729 [Cladochytrium replicatum]|nr:hypothetical protein BJ742DRAFT_832729 [Cladochytrium replicatum]